jgi:hypothetical protein
LKDREEGDRTLLFGFVLIFISIAIIQHGKDGSVAAEGDRAAREIIELRQYDVVAS